MGNIDACCDPSEDLNAVKWIASNNMMKAYTCIHNSIKHNESIHVIMCASMCAKSYLII